MSDSTSDMPSGELDQVRQGLRMATPPDPQRLAAEKDLLRELEHAPAAKRWRGYMKFIGPGYMQSAMTLGSGTAASSLFAGAVFGYDLLWVAPVGMLLGILAMGAVSHQTLSTGERVLPAMAKHAHPVVAWGFALAAMIASIVWHFPQYNLAAASLVDAASTIGLDGVPKMAASTFVLIWAVLLSTMYGKSPRLVRIYERFLKYTVWGIVVMLLWVLLNTETDWAGVANGFIPSLPEDRGDFRSIDLAVAGIASAVGVNMLLLYPYSLLARGWGREHRGLARFDLFAGMLLPYALASSLMVIAAANTLGDLNVQPSAAVGEMGRVLGEVVGPVTGTLIFDLGMLAMALSTITLHMVCCGFVAMEWFGLPFGSLRQRMFMLLPVPGFLAPLFWGDLEVYLAIPTSIFCGAMLPIAYVGFLLLQRSKSYLGGDRQRGLGGLVATGGLLVAMLVIVVSMIARFA